MSVDDVLLLRTVSQAMLLFVRLSYRGRAAEWKQRTPETYSEDSAFGVRDIFALHVVL